MAGDLLTIVFDTNVVLSFALWPRAGAIRACFAIAERPGVVLVYSDEMARELADVIIRPKFDRFVSRAARQGFLAAYFTKGRRVASPDVVSICRDPADNHILAAARTGRADVIVTGDDDLLVLDPFEGIAILSPADFVTRFCDAGADVSSV